MKYNYLPQHIYFMHIKKAVQLQRKCARLKYENTNIISLYKFDRFIISKSMILLYLRFNSIIRTLGDN